MVSVPARESYVVLGVSLALIVFLAMHIDDLITLVVLLGIVFGVAAGVYVLLIPLIPKE